jgi:metal-responsive CopG/Arc/MetJ family transcriptional regulator
MSNKTKQQNDAILAIRMPAKLLTQLDALAKAKYLGVSTMARNALAQYLIDEAPEALIGASTAPQVQIRQPQKTFSPSEQMQRQNSLSEIPDWE